MMDYVAKKNSMPVSGEDNYCSIYENRAIDRHRFPYTDEDVFYKEYRSLP